MDKETANRILRHNVGIHHWIDGSKGAWYYTTDEDDNTSGRTWPTLEALLADLTLGLGFMRIPDDVSIELPDIGEVKLIISMGVN